MQQDNSRKETYTALETGKDFFLLGEPLNNLPR